MFEKFIICIYFQIFSRFISNLVTNLHLFLLYQVPKASNDQQSHQIIQGCYDKLEILPEVLSSKTRSAAPPPAPSLKTRNERFLLKLWVIVMLFKHKCSSMHIKTKLQNLIWSSLPKPFRSWNESVAGNRPVQEISCSPQESASNQDSRASKKWVKLWIKRATFVLWNVWFTLNP